MAATIREPPSTTGPVIASPAAAASRAANNGSMVNTMAARGVGRWAWAQLCTTKATAVATTAVATRAAHVHSWPGGRSPPGSPAARLKPATVSSWTVARP
jgi:hypothetical protein